ncbi:carbohydrate ABC transporter permease [Paenibacillus eucommiae]|uniref:Aldouronate transport system permease protein n=1 Tax=Paenibacillus eucommiae TaxID=1355755 RepID=A0ABS4IQT2_9BACL|nr:carbohydrate ABC transporter permease [Paenibacillus eucommiae]MBP1989931.1 putative aldouronate transport system permease protein [Paenibacillus eucommiae]
MTPYMTIGEKLFQVFLVVFISVLSIMMVYPFIHELSISFSTTKEALRYGVHIFPLERSLDAYATVFASDSLWRDFGNTIFRTVVGTFLSLIFMTMSGYALSKKTLPNRGFWTLFIVFTMFFSGGLIPTFLLVKSLGLYDSRWAYIIPVLYQTFSMLIMRNFFMGIPEELEDSAKMDGANDISVLFRIIVPLSMPILATIALWTAVYHWNEWFLAMIYVQDPDKTVLQIFLRKLIIQNSGNDMADMMASLNTQATPDTIRAAVLMVTTLPILCFYPFLQKYFVKGILVGSLKG